MTRPVPRGITVVALGLVVAIATSGCVAAGLASGPLMSAVQAIGDRSVERTVAADLSEAVGVTEAVLAQMAFRIEDRQREERVRRFRAVADDVTVHVRLERVTGKLTRVALRVEAGRLLPDRDTGTQIHEQIAVALTTTAVRPSTPEPAAVEALTTLQGEIRKLRSDIDERRAAERVAPPGDTGTNLRLEHGAIVSVPMSAALPTVGGSVPPVSVMPAAPAAVASTPVPPGPRDETAPATFDARTRAVVRPAGTLTAVQPISGAPNGR